MSKAAPEKIPESLIASVGKRLEANERVRRNLPGNGRLHIDRQLPFLCVYRQPVKRPDAGTEGLVMSQAAYLTAHAKRSLRAGLVELVRNVVNTMTAAFGTFIIVEVWSAADVVEDDGVGLRRASFRIMTQGRVSPAETVAALERGLKRVRVANVGSEVEVVKGGRLSPPGMSPLLTEAEAKALNCYMIGIEARPVYRDAESGEAFPLVLRSLIRDVTRVLQQAFFEFVRTQTTQRPKHYHALGRRAMVKAVWEIDRRLSEISDAFDFLLMVTPVNEQRAWSKFKRGHYESKPTFRYRPLESDPAELKRKLWAIKIDRVEDPTIGNLFREKQAELDTQLTMLSTIGTPKFFYGSMQLYGAIDDALVATARELLAGFPAHSRDDAGAGTVNAQEFAQRAAAEIAHYQSKYPKMTAAVEVRDDTYSGLMVNRGNLLIGSASRIPARRVEALLQHEVGTHIVTYFNGRAQPFRQLYSGLAGYEELQEGLAVLAEFLAGGLNRPRLRLLAGRVAAARCLIDGATFVETFRELNEEFGFAKRVAFTITKRIYRGGGLTKDAVYLRGLVRLLSYLRKGGEIEPLFVGKIAENHLSIIRELQLRRVLSDAPLRPRYMEFPDIDRRLKQLRNGVGLADLVER